MIKTRRLLKHTRSHFLTSLYTTQNATFVPRSTECTKATEKSNYTLIPFQLRRHFTVSIRTSFRDHSLRLKRIYFKVKGGPERVCRTSVPLWSSDFFKLVNVGLKLEIHEHTQMFFYNSNQWDAKLDF